MSLIDGTYFFGDINLPSGRFSGADLNGFITKFEDEYLRLTLGHELATLVMAYDAGTSQQYIKDLVEGKEFAYNDKTCRWHGLINTSLESPIAYYVYYQYMRWLNSLTANVGEVKPKQENSVAHSPGRKLVDAWRKMYKLTCGNLGGYYVSLLTYLQQNTESYPEWDVDMFTELSNLNSMGV